MARSGNGSYLESDFTNILSSRAESAGGSRTTSNDARNRWLPPPRAPVSSKSATTGRTSVQETERTSLSSEQTRATGRFRFFQGRGISEAFTKRSSTNTFAPNFGAQESTREIFKSDPKIQSKAVDLSNIEYNRNAVGLKPERKRSSLYLLVPLILIFLAAGAATGLVFGLSSEEGDFCEEGDQNQRDLIAAEFDNALLDPNNLAYQGITIRCLPDDAFAALNESQLLSLENVTSILFDANSMKSVANKAFISPNLQGIEILSIIFNTLSNLGDDLLAELPNLQRANFFGNAFTTLDSDVFRNSAATVINLEVNPLSEIPNALVDCFDVREMRLGFCGSLVEFEDQMFSNLNLTSLRLDGSALIFRFDNNVELGEALGVDPDVIIFR